jgi:hypothetical protein
MFHRHHWYEVGRWFVPPVRDAELERGSRELMEALCFGFTAVELRCDVCGDVTTRRLPGNAVDLSDGGER